MQSSELEGETSCQKSGMYLPRQEGRVGGGGGG